MIYVNYSSKLKEALRSIRPVELNKSWIGDGHEAPSSDESDTDQLHCIAWYVMEWHMVQVEIKKQTTHSFQGGFAFSH